MSAEAAFAAMLQHYCGERYASGRVSHGPLRHGAAMLAGEWAAAWVREHEVEPLRQEVERLRAALQEAHTELVRASIHSGWPHIAEHMDAADSVLRAALGAQEPRDGE